MYLRAVVSLTDPLKVPALMVHGNAGRALLGLSLRVATIRKRSTYCLVMTPFVAVMKTRL